MVASDWRGGKVNCREWYKLVVERQLGALNCYADSWRTSRLYPRVDSRPAAHHIALRYSTFLAQLGRANRKGSAPLSCPNYAHWTKSKNTNIGDYMRTFLAAALVFGLLGVLPASSRQSQTNPAAQAPPWQTWPNHPLIQHNLTWTRV